MRLHGFLIGQTETLLAEVLKLNGPADATTSRFFRAHPKLGHGERGVIAEAVFAVLRRRMEFAHLAESGTGSPARRMALLGLMQTAGRSALKPFVYRYRIDWLEHVAKIDPESLPLRIRLNLPDWIYQALSQALRARGTGATGRRAELPGAAGPAREPDQGEPRRRADALSKAGIEAGATPFAPFGVRVVGKPPLTKLDAFQHGWRRSAGRGQPVAVLAGRAQARRNDRRFLRGRGRQDAGAGRGDAFHRAVCTRSTSPSGVWPSSSRALRAAGCRT